MKKNILLGIAILTLALAILFGLGFKEPPSTLKSTEVSMINAVAVNQDKEIQLTETEKAYWASLEFQKVSDEYPGETPDYVVKLIGDKTKLTAIYNKSSGIIFFSFLPEISYGVLNSPPPGGWNQPLYKTNASDLLLRLLKVEE